MNDGFARVDLHQRSQDRFETTARGYRWQRDFGLAQRDVEALPGDVRPAT